MIPSAIYLMCFVTCLGCSILLWRGYRNTATRLLLWGAMGFFILGVSNLLLFADLVLYPAGSLATVRSLFTLFGLAVFLVGLVFESE